MKGNADCAKIAEMLFAYLDGELQLEDAEDLQQHFHRCAPCLRRMELEKAFGKVIRARAQGREVPEGLEDRIRTEIGRRGGGPGEPVQAVRPLVWLAAAAVFFTTVGMTAVLAPRAVSAPPGPEAVQADETIEGLLVCVYCESDLEYAEPHEHRNGILRDDGTIWHIVDTESSRGIIESDEYRGRRIRAEGLVYGPARTVEVRKADWI